MKYEKEMETRKILSESNMKLLAELEVAKKQLAAGPSVPAPASSDNSAEVEVAIRNLQIQKQKYGSEVMTPSGFPV